MLKKRDSNTNGISNSINEWLSESSKNPSSHRNKYQNKYDSERYKYWQISEAENGLSSNHNYVKTTRNFNNRSPNSELSGAKINKNNEKESVNI